MKILLIKPAWFKNGVYENCRLARVPPLNLGILAALSAGHEAVIADENAEEIPSVADWDMVGISVAASTALRTYAIADKFLSLGVKVVLGGVHVSLMQEEALKHADCIIAGEPESVWTKILNDFPKLDRIYYGETLADLDEIPFPRRDLFHPSYITAPLQMTHGCVYDCDYCYLQSVPWKRYRERSVHLIEEEVEGIGHSYLLVVDDNLFLDRSYVLEVACRIKRYKKFWGVQAPVSLGEDRELLSELSSSGLCGVSLGIDFAIKESLVSASKTQNDLSKLKKSIKNFHDFGIGVSGLFVFGFEGERKQVFQRSVDIIMETNIDCGTFFVLTPCPGTQMYKDLEKQGRILTRDWSQYNWKNVVFKPSGMSEKELQEGTEKMYRTIRKKGSCSFIK